MIDPTGGIPDGTTFSGYIDQGTGSEIPWGPVSFGEFSGPIQVMWDALHIVMELDPGGD